LRDDVVCREELRSCDGEAETRFDGGASFMVVSGAVRLRALGDDVITLRLTDELRVFVLVVVTEEEEEMIDRGGEIVFFWKRLKMRR